MLFNSIRFLIFFPIVVILYFLIPHKYRWMLLLAASYYFYMCWKAEYAILLVISTMIDYLCSRRMDMLTDKKKRRKYLIISLISNFTLLFMFKYFNFFNNSAREVFNFFNIFYNVPSFKLLLPVGISFYTFQTVSYTIDVYKGEQKAEKHLGIFAVYVTFFPQLVAGPIERSGNLLHQFYRENHFDYQRVVDGLKIMLWGFFKKVVIADRLAGLVNQIYNNAQDYTGFPLMLATYFFAFQIYCDFSGYSDIAIGAAQIMGYKLMDNFKRPYHAKSIREFWQRWHISLSTWFKDYVYFPLGGNRVGKFRLYFNLFIVFFLSGIWHGANWTFVIWGALYGFFMIFSFLTQKYRDKLYDILHFNEFFKKLIRAFLTFQIVCFAWIFFRANNLDDALYIVQNIFNFKFGGHDPISYIRYLLSFDYGLKYYEIFIGVLTIIFMEAVHLMQRHNKMRQFLNEKPIWFRWAVYYAIFLSILVFGVFNLREFIYFQF